MMSSPTARDGIDSWITPVVRSEEIDRYCSEGRDFIDDERIEADLHENRDPDPGLIRDILDRALALQRLEPAQTAALLNVTDSDLWEEIFHTARAVKDKVYGPRIVTFAPLYCSNLCTNSCLYCGFRRENRRQKRRLLSLEEIRAETEVLVSMGHKRLVVVYGEHPRTDIHYIAESIQTIYATTVGNGEIRR
ncbi:MAG: radical SAM protein, partial [bacterium]